MYISMALLIGVICEFPVTPANGEIIIERFLKTERGVKVPRAIRYGCKRGFVASGSGGFRMCRATGSWSGNPIICVRKSTLELLKCLQVTSTWTHTRMHARIHTSFLIYCFVCPISLVINASNRVLFNFQPFIVGLHNC